MSPSDIASVFSRYFIVGFFLPAFFVVTGTAQALSPRLLPAAYEQLGDGARLLVLGGVGLLLGLLLLGLHWQIFRLYEGYPLVSHGARRPVRDSIGAALVKRQRSSFERLIAIRDDDAAASAARSDAAWKLDRQYPPAAKQLLPTRFGNAVLAFESHAMRRWGLDSIVVWPRIDMLLSEREAELQANARSEAAFFVNGSLLLLVAAAALALGRALDSAFWEATTLLCLVPLLFAWLAARGSIGAATRWGNTVRAAIDLHRFELYERLGVRRPTSFTDERGTVAPRVNQALLYGNPIPDSEFAPDSADPEEEIT